MSAVSSYLVISSRLLSVHLNLGRPLHLFPGTTMSIIFLDRLSSSLLFSWHVRTNSIVFVSGMLTFGTLWHPMMMMIVHGYVAGYATFCHYQDWLDSHLSNWFLWTLVHICMYNFLWHRRMWNHSCRRPNDKMSDLAETYEVPLTIRKQWSNKYYSYYSLSSTQLHKQHFCIGIIGFQ